MPNEAPPQTDEVYWILSGIGIVREVAPVDGGEPEAVLAKDTGRQSGSRLLKTLGIATAAVTAGGSRIFADPSSPTVIDVLQFALNGRRNH